MKKLLIAFVALALPQFTWGQLIFFDFKLTGSQEVPARVTPASGAGTASLNLASNFFEIDYAFSGLLGPQTGAHIHGPATFGVNAPVLIPFALGSPISFETTLTAAQADQVLSGLWYVNIHSTVFPGGEIRGQIVPVPEPSTYAIAGAAVLGLLVWRRRRAGARAA